MSDADGTEKIVVDVADLTLGEMAEATEAAGDTDAPGGAFRQMAAMAWVTKRRTDPTFTLADALALRMGDLDITNQPPEVPSGATGVTPQLSAVSGTSAQAT